MSAFLVDVSNSSLVQSSHCLVTAGRHAVKKGRDFWLESISLTPEKLYFPFSAKSKNIRERTFLCLADVAGEVGSVRAGTGVWEHNIGSGRGNGKVVCFHRLQG